MTTCPCIPLQIAPSGFASMGRAYFPSSSDQASVPLTPLDQPRGEEPVQARAPRVVTPQVTRQRAQIPLRGEALGEAANLFGGNGQAPHVWITAQERGDLSFALLGFERAYAIDNGASRPRPSDRRVEQSCVALDGRSEVALAFEPADVGMAADRAGRAARRVQEHRVER